MKLIITRWRFQPSGANARQIDFKGAPTIQRLLYNRLIGSRATFAPRQNHISPGVIETAMIENAFIEAIFRHEINAHSQQRIFVLPFQWAYD